VFLENEILFYQSKEKMQIILGRVLKRGAGDMKLFSLALQSNSGLGRLHETFRFTSVTRSRIVGRTT
jgi:hypothetical protein